MLEASQARQDHKDPKARQDLQARQAQRERKARKEMQARLLQVIARQPGKVHTGDVPHRALHSFGIADRRSVIGLEEAAMFTVPDQSNKLAVVTAYEVTRRRRDQAGRRSAQSSTTGATIRVPMVSPAHQVPQANRTLLTSRCHAK